MGWYTFSHSVEMSIESFFERLGRFIVRNTCLTFTLSLVVSLACGLGFANMHSESAIDKLWVPENSVAKKNFDYISETYDTPETGVSTIVAGLQETENVLTKSYFDIFWEVDKVIRTMNVTFEGSVYRYEDVCMMSETYSGCANFGALNFWSNSRAAYESSVSNDADLLRDLRIGEYPLDGVKVVYGFQTLGKAEYDASTGEITEARAIKGIWNLKPCDADETTCPSDQFQKEYIKVMEVHAKSKESEAQVTFQAGISLGEALNEAIAADLPLVGASYLIMVVFCCFSLGEGLRKGAAGRRSSMSLGGGAVFTVFMSTIAGYGISAGCGVWFTSLHSLLPLLLVGIGIDDAYVIVNQFKLTRDTLPLEERIAATLRNCGMAILYTSLTDFIAFFLGSTSSLKGISAFCIYAAVSIFVDFILQVTMFIAILVWDQKRQAAGRMDCCICCKFSKESEEESQTRIKRSNTEFWFSASDGAAIKWDEIVGTNGFFGWLAHFLHRNAYPIIVLFIAYWGVSIWGCTKNTEGFDSRDLVLDQNHYKIYNTLNQDMELSTYNNMPPVGLYVEGVDYTRAKVQKSIMDLNAEAILRQPYVRGPADCWVDSFMVFLEDKDDVCLSAPCDFSDGVDLTEDLLKKHIADFTNSTTYSRFRSHIITDDSGMIIASRSWLYHKGVEETDDQVIAMDSLVKFCDEWTGLSPKPWPDSWIYLYVYQFKIISSELFMNFTLVIIAVGIISPFVLKQPVAVLILILIVALIDVDLYASIYFWGVQVNSLTMIGLVMAVGLVVDYNAHITHCFFMADPNLARPERLSVAMKTMGKSVFMGGLTTLLGVIPLAFAQSELFRIFFKMFVSIIVFGLMHGLIFGPTLLSILPIPTPDILVDLHAKWRANDVEKGSYENPATSDAIEVKIDDAKL